MKKYKICIFGVKHTSEVIIEHLYQNKIQVDLVISIPTSVAERNHISGYLNLESVAKKVGAFYYPASCYSLKSLENNFFLENDFDLGISYGWQRIIPESILTRFKHGVFGFHASPDFLPKGRGRSPMNWAILLGKKAVYDHLFKYDEGADTGDIYSIKKLDISVHDTIATLELKALLNAKLELMKLINDLEMGNITLKPQIGKGYFLEKRTPEDGVIKFDLMNTTKIINLIRSVTKPFPGAFCYNDRGEKILIWKAAPFIKYFDFTPFLVGEVIDKLYDLPIIKTKDGSIIIHEYEGAKLLPGMRLFPLSGNNNGL